MRIAVRSEHDGGERRVALVPESCKKLVKAGLEVVVQAGAGQRAFLSDEAFREAGARIVDDPQELLGQADLLVTVQPPRPDDTLSGLSALRPGSILLGVLQPTRNAQAIARLAERRISVLALDLIPRITRAQPMDVLSSMANLAGYKGVLLAANLLPRFFPMLMTAAGTIVPARVFVIGAGVAGLQAIATARRLGATVEATDTRPAARQDIESLGARFVGIEGGEQAQDERGYARELSADFYRRQAELIARHCAAADVVITTALIGGVKAPRLVTEPMVRGMRAGSVIVDLAAPGGGNCELSVPGQVVERHGVTIAAPLNLPAEMPLHGSILYSRNVTSFILEFCKDGQFRLDEQDEIIRATLVAHEGRVLHAGVKEALQPRPVEQGVLAS